MSGTSESRKQQPGVYSKVKAAIAAAAARHRRKRLGKAGSEAAEEALEKQRIREIAQYIGETELDEAFNSLVYGSQNNVNEEGLLLLNSKGSVFWKGQLEGYSESAEKLIKMYRHSLEEKRNFLTFALTMCTILLSPIVVMTSYW